MKPSKQYTFNAPVSSVDDLAEVIKTHSTFYHRSNRNADGTPQRWRTNGQLKRWIKDRSRMRLPVKQGLYNTSAVESLDEFNTYLAYSYTEV